MILIVGVLRRVFVLLLATIARLKNDARCDVGDRRGNNRMHNVRVWEGGEGGGHGLEMLG